MRRPRPIPSSSRILSRGEDTRPGLCSSVEPMLNRAPSRYKAKLFRSDYNVLLMKRYIAASVVILFALVGAAVLVSYVNRPSETDYRLARGRAQIYTENYLAALQTLRDFPDARKA